MDRDFFDAEEELIPVRTFLVFEVSGKNFSVETNEVKEIVMYTEPTPVPEFPDYVCGVANVKGRTVPVINSARRFRYEDKGLHSRKCIIICSVSGDREIGLLADNVIKLRNVDVDKVLDPPQVNSEAFTRYIKGLFIRTNGTPCYIVSPELMMSEEEQESIFGGSDSVVD